MRQLELIFVNSPRVSGILGYLESKEVVREAHKVGITHLGTPGPPGAPWWVVPPVGVKTGRPQVVGPELCV